VLARRDLLQVKPDASTSLYEGAVRLFNGFYEGCPGLVIDLYAATLVLFNHADPPASLDGFLQECIVELTRLLPWVKTALLKTRAADTQTGRWGKLVKGTRLDVAIREHGVRYAIDLTLNSDASFYLDTRELRAWVLRNLAGKTVLNTFSYTGSLGTAARAAGATRVVNLDRNQRFLQLARQSCALNGFQVEHADFIAADFFPAVSRMRREGAQYDCVILDPPFFARTSRGRVDMLANTAKLVNKVRPLVCHGGWLVAVNNALYLSGEEYLQILRDLGSDGYMSLEALIPVPTDVTGYPETLITRPPVDPAPFNHPTKIAVLRVRRKGKETQCLSQPDMSTRI
jgi:23S rRNA (cytosine1962-C5)-methyltransferase